MRGNSWGKTILLLISLVVICSLGLLMVYSATHNESATWQNSFWFRQSIFIGVGIIVMLVIRMIPISVFYDLAYPIYFLSLFFLLYLAIGGGVSSHGAGRWINIGFQFQPSELAKVAYLLAMARMLSQSPKLTMNKPKLFAMPLLLFSVPFLLILKQPDLSTALVFMAVTLVGFYWTGLSIVEILLMISPILSVMASMNQVIWGVFFSLIVFLLIKYRIDKKLSGIIVVTNISAAYASFLVWNKILKEHQRSRILTFLDPMRDPRGEGYQVIQSKVAIGSGGITGKGLGKGSQTNLDFLPEEHTDFIFSVLGEQFGFLGTAMTLLFFFLLLFSILVIVTYQKNNFGNYLIVGIATILGFHIVVNVAMTLGLMPVTGLPLPFFSYGGTFMLTCMALMGIVLSVSKNKEY